MTPRTVRMLAALGVAVTLLAGCTGVPQSSTPEVVRSVAVGGGDAPQPPQPPAPGILPQTLVRNFLSVNAVTPASTRRPAAT